MTEADLQVQVADYLRLRYPNVLFHSDFGSGIKLTIGQAAKQKRQNGGRRAWPDLFLAESKPLCPNGLGSRLLNGEAARNSHLCSEAGSTPARGTIFCGLFLELKKEGTRLKKKNGEWASDHIREQAGVLALLRERGYEARFAIGFDEAKRIIDEYMDGGCLD